ncbi:hypothetical protein CVT26_006386 [Gymnopilus dilepis]|uniref:Uncharacterized protein n=1 Tax=Gymnopilus dilepis TaxID=231916 RepID=A0A409Y0L2_9AGAR|nr:hypothetical protein CVT26_006386 [Gymnopilus dilepis]
MTGINRSSNVQFELLLSLYYNLYHHLPPPCLSAPPSLLRLSPPPLASTLAPAKAVSSNITGIGYPPSRAVTAVNVTASSKVAYDMSPALSYARPPSALVYTPANPLTSSSPQGSRRDVAAAAAA